MMMGEFQHNMDLKGRVAVPFKFRVELGEKFYVTQGMDGCLFLMSEQEMEAMMEKISAMPMGKGRGILRHFTSRSCDVEPDKQGRIVIPQTLRDYAGLEKDVTIIGSGHRAEVWDTARWQAYLAAQTDEVVECDMEEMGF